MSFPKTSREIYVNNPLTEVICQIRYPAILEIAAQSPVGFQNSVRMQYPWYEQQNAATLPKDISDVLSGLPIPMPSFPQQPEHHFSTEDKKRSISLTQEFIAVSERAYGKWEDFRTEMVLAEEILRETYSPSFYTRIGLRYIDILNRDDYGLHETPWLQLLNPLFIGMLGSEDLSNEVREFQVETLLRVPNVAGGLVTIRHGLVRDQSGDQQLYRIDADFYTENRSSPENAFAILDRFNEWGGHFFRWAISDKLRHSLQPKKS